MYIYFTMYEKEMFTFLQILSKTFLLIWLLCIILIFVASWKKKWQFFIFHNTQTDIKAEQHSKNSQKH